MMPQKWRRPAGRPGDRGSNYDDKADGTRRTAKRSSSAPRLLIHLDEKPRIYILADDLDQEREARGVARAIEWLLAVLEREAAA